ncbi:hypothetical protein HZS_4795 [Henneguya salminicola]|nr:hypothetical protein HZS_4795 [Henneguya salminicola]
MPDRLFTTRKRLMENLKHRHAYLSDDYCSMLIENGSVQRILIMISPNLLHAYSLECFRKRLKKPGCRVLDVGSGSGYLTLCMSLMNGSTGTVIGIDHFEELIELAKNNISKAGYDHLLDEHKIKFICFECFFYV